MKSKKFMGVVGLGLLSLYLLKNRNLDNLVEMEESEFIKITEQHYQPPPKVFSPEEEEVEEVEEVEESEEFTQLTEFDLATIRFVELMNTTEMTPNGTILYRKYTEFIKVEMPISWFAEGEYASLQQGFDLAIHSSNVIDDFMLIYHESQANTYVDNGTINVKIVTYLEHKFLATGVFDVI